jgi:hypothetical protein
MIDGNDPLVFVADGPNGLVVLPTQCGATTDVEASNVNAPPFRLSISPNPGFARGVIRFETTKNGLVEATILDASGRRVRQVFRGTLGAGEQLLTWDGRDHHGRSVPPGVYFVRVSSPDGTSNTRYVAMR